MDSFRGSVTVNDFFTIFYLVNYVVTLCLSVFVTVFFFALHTAMFTNVSRLYLAHAHSKYRCYHDSFNFLITEAECRNTDLNG